MPSAGGDDSPRLALANWLASDDNFLATRVIVNRIWQHHFGHGLVQSPSDFGVMGESPSHPELLDWLAGEFARRGGSLKQLHKLMLTSATYRQTSRPAENPSPAELARWQSATEIDPENRLLWRANRRRLDGEAIRDCMLAAADRLSPKRGGPGVMPPLPDELTITLLKDQWKPSPDEEDHRRRSIYIFARRNLRFPFFEAFDRPETTASCPAAATINHRAAGPVTAQLRVLTERSTRFGRTLFRTQAGDDFDAQIDLVYRRTLGHATYNNAAHPRPTVSNESRKSIVGSADITVPGRIQLERVRLRRLDRATPVPSTCGRLILNSCSLPFTGPPISSSGSLPLAGRVREGVNNSPCTATQPNAISPARSATGQPTQKNAYGTSSALKSCAGESFVATPQSAPTSLILFDSPTNSSSNSMAHNIWIR